MSIGPNITVVGAGLMGHALALDFSLRNQPVRITDAVPRHLATVHERLRTDLLPFLSAGMLDPESATEVVDRVTLVADIAEAVRQADYIVEAIIENLEEKQSLFADLEQFASANTIIASNTSGLRATDLAASLLHPERLIVAHYFNPPYLIPAVEVVPGQRTSDTTTDFTVDLLRSLGKRPVVLRAEAPGFIANRLQAALLREAIHLVSTGVATTEDIDTIMSGAVGRRLAVMGPFQVLDFAGIDVWSQIGRYLFDDLDRSNDAQTFLERLAADGRAGTKTGRGVYTWSLDDVRRWAAVRDQELLRFAQRDTLLRTEEKE